MVRCFIYFHRRGLPTVLTLKLQARVILVCNVETEIGLYNGAHGVIPKNRFLASK